MKNSNKSARGFIAHLGLYTILIGMLAGINLLASPGELWFLYPGLVWGAGLAFHLLWKLPLAKLRTNWRIFLRHVGAYLITIMALAGINLIEFHGEAWFLYPAFIWGAIVALHFLFGLVLSQTDGSQARIANPATAKQRATPPKRASRLAGRVRLSNKKIQAYLDKAVSYKTEIEAMVAATSNEIARSRLHSLTAQVEVWTEDIKDLAQRIDYFEQNALIRRDLELIPKTIREIEARLASEPDQASRITLERTLQNHHRQLAALEQLRHLMQQAEIQIESTLSALGAVYFQILAGQSASHVADYSHLAAEVAEEVQALQDHLEALREVKFGRM